MFYFNFLNFLVPEAYLEYLSRFTSRKPEVGQFEKIVSNLWPLTIFVEKLHREFSSGF